MVEYKLYEYEKKHGFRPKGIAIGQAVIRVVRQECCFPSQIMPISFIGEYSSTVTFCGLPVTEAADPYEVIVF